MNAPDLLGFVVRSRTLDEFSFAVLSSASSKVFHNSYVILYPEEDSSSLVLARITRMTTWAETGQYIADCRVLASLDAERKLGQLSRPVSSNSKVYLPSEEQLTAFLRMADDSVILGSISGFANVRFPISLEAFKKTSTLVTGMTGSGKKATVLSISRQLAKHNFATLIFDIYGEYKEDLEQEATVLAPGENFTLPFDNHLISSLIETSLSTSGEARILYETYSRYGDLDAALSSLREEAGPRSVYMQRSYREVESRLSELKAKGLLSKMDAEFKALPLRKGTTVLDLSDLSVNSQLLIANYALVFLLSSVKRGFGNPVYVVLDEAQRFVPKMDIRRLTISRTAQNVMSQGRKYHISLCLVTQKPSLCDPIVLSNCGLQIIHTLVNPIDLQALSEISEYIERSYLYEIPKITIGHALVFGAELRFPAIVSTS